jgi:hypothetical protein
VGLFGRKKIKTPVDGWAEVVEAWSDRNNQGAYSNCKMKLNLVDVPGVEPQVVKHHELSLPPTRWPEVGMRVAVTVDLNHPDRVDPHWDSVFGEMRGGAAGYVAEGLLSAAGVEVSLSKGDPNYREPQPAADYMEQIAELNRRHAAGEITYDEMAAAIARVMDVPGY